MTPPKKLIKIMGSPTPSLNCNKTSLNDLCIGCQTNKGG